MNFFDEDVTDTDDNVVEESDSFFEDTRSDDEVEKAVKEEKGVTDKQISLREGGFSSKSSEETLEGFSDVE